MSWYKQQNKTTQLFIKVVPNASRTEVGGVLGNRLKIRVASPAEGGKANSALVAFLAKRLSIRKQAITIKFGTSSPEKNIIINALVDAQLLVAVDPEAVV